MLKALMLRQKFDGASFSEHTWCLILNEYAVWKQHYLPTAPIPKDAHVLDAGAGEGETIFFFARHGFHNFRAVECEQRKFALLQRNVKCWNVDELNREFRIEDLNGMDYAKIDIEGGEEALLQLVEIPCEIVVEVHSAKLLEAFLKKWPTGKVTYRVPFNPEISILHLYGRH